jgi:hypothetical protein
MKGNVTVTKKLADQLKKEAIVLALPRLSELNKILQN